VLVVAVFMNLRVISFYLVIFWTTLAAC